MTKEMRERLGATSLHWSRAWTIALLAHFAIHGRHHPIALAPIVFNIACSTIVLARAQRIEWGRTVQTATLATFCALTTGAAVDLLGAGWWDVAFLLCAMMAPVVWATSSIIWNLGNESESRRSPELASTDPLVTSPVADAPAIFPAAPKKPAQPPLYRGSPPAPLASPRPSAPAPTAPPVAPPPPIQREPPRARSMIQTITAFAVSANARRLALLRDVATASDGLMTPTLARLLAGRGDDKVDRDRYLADAKAEAKDIADSASRQLAQALDELIAGRPDPEAPVEVEIRPGVRKAVQWGTHKAQLLSCELHAADVEGCLRRSGIAGSAWQIERVDFVAWLVELRHDKELTTRQIPQSVRQDFAGAFLAFTDVVNPEAGARIRVQLLRRALAASKLLWTP